MGQIKKFGRIKYILDIFQFQKKLHWDVGYSTLTIAFLWGDERMQPVTSQKTLFQTNKQIHITLTFNPIFNRYTLQYKYIKYSL